MQRREEQPLSSTTPVLGHFDMTTSTLTFESRQIALDLHALLNDLEPARWKDEKIDEMRLRLQDIQTRVENLLDAYAKNADQKLESMRARYDELGALIGEYRPTFESETLDELREAWMAFRESAEPAYEALATSLKANDLSVPSLRPSNYTRNFFHILAAAISIAVVELLPAITGLDFWIVIAVAASFALWGWSMEISRRVSKRANAFLMKAFKHVAHPHEAHHVNSSTWYVTALLLLSLTYNPAVCAVALAILGLADPAAAIVGKRGGRIRFENGRSVEGTLTFILVGTLAGMGILSTLHSGQWSVGQMVLLSLLSATAGGVTELVSKRVDDNLGIPVAAGAAAFALVMLMS